MRPWGQYVTVRLWRIDRWTPVAPVMISSCINEIPAVSAKTKSNFCLLCLYTCVGSLWCKNTPQFLPRLTVRQRSVALSLDVLSSSLADANYTCDCRGLITRWCNFLPWLDELDSVLISCTCQCLSCKWILPLTEPHLQCMHYFLVVTFHD